MTGLVVDLFADSCVTYTKRLEAEFSELATVDDLDAALAMLTRPGNAAFLAELRRRWVESRERRLLRV